MSTNNSMTQINEQTIYSLKEICNIILVSEDKLDIVKGKEYIEEQIDNDVNWCGDKNEVRFYVLNSISDYIDNCPTSVQLFAFANDNKFYKFRMELTTHYFYHYYFTHGTNTSIQFPRVLNYAFDCIQEAIDTNSLFHKFSIKMTNDIVERATKEATDASSEAAITARFAASKAANEAIDIVVEQVMNDKHIEKQISDKVHSHIGKVTSNVSETSVTILGMFSGIVLAVVAGLFYSSSVLESVCSADFYRLLCISALVGFVCLNLIVFMFKFIACIGKHEKIKFFSDLSFLFVNIFLIVVMILGGVLQFIFHPNNNIESKKEQSPSTQSEISVSINEPPKEIVVSPENAATEINVTGKMSLQ